jgi:hypothetical protein
LVIRDRIEKIRSGLQFRQVQEKYLASAGADGDGILAADRSHCRQVRPIRQLQAARAETIPG